ncbi:hypothetical protein ACLOJK_013682 [Asimina triloba]
MPSCVKRLVHELSRTCAWNVKPRSWCLVWSTNKRAAYGLWSEGRAATGPPVVDLIEFDNLQLIGSVNPRIMMTRAAINDR